MLNIKKKKDQQYLYLVPAENGLAKWEIIEQDELENRVEENLLEEESRLFKIDKEIFIKFEKITHLEF
ncbi:hypothetical protein KJ966_14500 [bacterium]|nr:hypothetical protein [bacterium]